MKNITQSFIKDVEKYSKNELCGLQIQAKYYDNIKFPTSDVQLLGQWFEFKATGQKNRFGEEPQPITLKNGKLSKKFNDILEHIGPFKKMLEENNFEIIETGLRIKVRGLQGDIDLVLKDKTNDKIVFGDIKTTALINDRWNDFGWNEDSLQYKPNLMIQPIHYKLLGFLKYGYVPDFYFFIFSSTNTIERKLLKIEINESRLDEHMNFLEKIYEIKNQAEQYGWIAIPDVKTCGSCPVKDSCDHFTEIPKAKTIYY